MGSSWRNKLVSAFEGQNTHRDDDQACAWKAASGNAAVQGAGHIPTSELSAALPLSEARRKSGPIAVTITWPNIFEP